MIFGESATGKKTLIEKLINEPHSEISNALNLNNEEIKVLEATLTNNVSSFSDVENEQIRHVSIMNEIKNFVEQDSQSILLIKGQSNDMDERYGNTLKQFALLYPEIEKEILLLEVKDLDILYERIINKDWFLADKERYLKMFPRSWLDNAVQKHKKVVYSYENLGFNIKEIDTTNDYKLVKKEEEYGQSSSIRR